MVQLQGEQDDGKFKIENETWGALTLSNGRVEATIDMDEAFGTLSSCVSGESARSLLNEIHRLDREMKQRIIQGQTLGSSDLGEAVRSCFFSDDPQHHGQLKNYARYGLKTEAELGLAAAYLGKMVRDQKWIK